MPKFTLEKKKVEMIQKNSSKKTVKKPKNDLEFFREKTRVLIDSIESLIG